jgi:hypothetical protein
MFDSDALELMRSIVQYLAYADRDLYGQPSFADPTKFPAHITYKTTIVRTSATEESVSTAQLQMPPGGFVWYYGEDIITIPVISIDDQVILPDGTQRKVLAVTTYTDETSTPANHQSIALT